MITYFDASVILRRALRQPNQIALTDIDRTASSSLTRVECLRTADRLRVLGALDEPSQLRMREVVFEVFETCSVIEVGPLVLQRASMPFPVPIKTLDALHLASALILQESRGEPVRLATHDRALARASRAMGFEVIGVA